jgi:hypothetical protein
MYHRRFEYCWVRELIYVCLLLTWMGSEVIRWDSCLPVSVTHSEIFLVWTSRGHILQEVHSAWELGMNLGAEVYSGAGRFLSTGPYGLLRPWADYSVCIESLTSHSRYFSLISPQFILFYFNLCLPVSRHLVENATAISKATDCVMKSHTRDLQRSPMCVDKILY